MLHTGSIAPSHCSMHLCSITWIQRSIQGDALASFSWHREARCCEEGTGPYATILGGKERISCGWGEGGWMNQWWVIRDPDRINGCFCITYLLTYIYKWDMELGFTNPVTNHWSTNFLGHRKSGRLVFFRKHAVTKICYECCGPVCVMWSQDQFFKSFRLWRILLLKVELFFCWGEILFVWDREVVDLCLKQQECGWCFFSSEVVALALRREMADGTRDLFFAVL